MEITFHARYTDGRRRFEGLDHYDGAQSLLGLSQILLIALNSFLNKEILVQAPSAKGFRLVLGKSKEGSWDQAIHLLITNPDVLAVAEDIGKSGLYDLLKWALLSGVGIRHLGSGLVDHSQKMTVAARVMAEKKAVGQRS